MARRDRSLDTLLDLDGQTMVIHDDGYFVQFRVRRTNVTEARPHGLSYSLTLHDRTGRRLLGFDNAHAVDRPGGRFVEQARTFDHVHRGKRDKGRPYEFRDAAQLVTDFWAEVDKMLEELTKE